MKVKAYLLDVARFQQEPMAEGDEFCLLCENLSQGRRQKIGKFRHGKGKALSLGAGLLLDYGLSRYGLRERDVVIGYGEDKKPYLRDFPGIHFNLSHSGSLAMAVFADCEVGCDIEKVAVPDMRVAYRFFAAGEVEALKGVEGEKLTEYFFRFWTLKESFLKVTGKGIRMPLDEFCIRLDPPVRAEQGGRSLGYGFAEYAYPGYRAALCIEKPEGENWEGAEPEVLSWEQIRQHVSGIKNNPFQNPLDVI